MLQLIGLREGERIILLFASLLTAALAGRSFGLLNDFPWIPRLAGGGSAGGHRRGGRGGGGGRGGKPARSSRQSRDFDRVVSGPWSGGGGGAPTASGGSAADQAEMDRLLDKMNSVGLSESERRRLTELGRRLRGS